MAEPAAKAEAAPKRGPRKTGVPEMDAIFDRIREDRKAARDNLKELRKQFKKDWTGGRSFVSDTLCFSFPGAAKTRREV